MQTTVTGEKTFELIIFVCREIHDYYCKSFESFSHQLQSMVSPWRLSDSKCSQASRTFLSILTDLNNVVVWMVSTRPLISKSSSLCINPLVTVPRAPITIYITVTFIFYGFFQFNCKRSRYLFFLSFSSNFTLWSAGTAKSTIQQVLFFLLLTIIRSGNIVEIM